MDTKSITRFVVVWVVNSLIVYLANFLFPTEIVLGTWQLTAFAAAIITGFLVTVLTRVTKSLRGQFNLKLKGREQMFIFYWLANSIGLWLIARVAPITGFGISIFYWAFLLGLILTFSQWLVRQIFKSQKLS